MRVPLLLSLLLQLLVSLSASAQAANGKLQIHFMDVGPRGRGDPDQPPGRNRHV
jgi:hypothetical protein